MIYKIAATAEAIKKEYIPRAPLLRQLDSLIKQKLIEYGESPLVDFIEMQKIVFVDKANPMEE